MTTAKQNYAKELIATYRKQESLMHTIGQCQAAIIRYNKALLMAGLPGQKFSTDEIAKRVRTMSFRLTSIASELQTLSMLIDVAQDDTEHILELMGGCNELQTRRVRKPVSEPAGNLMGSQSALGEAYCLLSKLTANAKGWEGEDSQ